MNDEYIDILEWLIQVQPIFYTILYRSLNRRMEAPLYMRKINDNGIQEIFKIYTHAKLELKIYKKSMLKKEISDNNRRNYVEF